ncbi:MAG: TonB-dependent receptor [Bacteroidetes bacterium]|nr:TonB-dependent receptor [Bacteroidota bacterium]
MRVSCLIFLLPLFASFGVAQPTDLRGIVADSASGERLPFASVQIMSLNLGGSTNFNGFYLLTNVPPGTYEVAASSIGYLGQTRRVTVRPGVSTVLNFELSARPVEFSEVVVTERARRELSEINTSVHVMDVAQMRSIPSVMQPDVFRAIQILPGVVSSSDVNTHFYVRGGAGDQNLIMLDGMKIFNPFHAFGIFSLFDPDIIKTTEVYTGAFPAGFGGRLSSVVSMLTRDGNRKEYAAKAEASLASSKLQVEGPIYGATRFLASARVSTFSNVLDRVLRKDLPLSFYDAFVKITGEDLVEHSRYGFTGFFSGDDLRSRSSADPDYVWRNYAVGFNGGGLINERLFFDVVAYENMFEASRRPRNSSSTPTRTKIRETGVRTQATKYTDSKDLFFVGFEFSFPSVDYEVVNLAGIPRSVYSTFVDFWTWIRYQAKVGPWQVDGGVHLDAGSIFQRSVGLEAVEPRLNVSLLLAPQWKWKASYGRFSQHLITVNNEDDVIPIFDAWIEVPREIGSQRADHYVTGFEGNPWAELSVSVQSYYKHYRALVTYNRDKVEAEDPDYVKGRGRAYGLETLVRVGRPGWDLYATHTLGWTTVTNGAATYPPRHDRRHSVNLLGIARLEPFEFTARWEFGSGFPFTPSIGYYDRLTYEDLFERPIGEQPSEPYLRLGEKNVRRLPVYHRLDLGAHYRFSVGRLRGSLGVQIANVYDRANVFYVDRATGRVITMLPFFPSITLTAEY